MRSRLRAGSVGLGRAYMVYHASHSGDFGQKGIILPTSIVPFALFLIPVICPLRIFFDLLLFDVLRPRPSLSVVCRLMRTLALLLRKPALSGALTVSRVKHCGLARVVAGIVRSSSRVGRASPSGRRRQGTRAKELRAEISPVAFDRCSPVALTTGTQRVLRRWWSFRVPSTCRNLLRVLLTSVLVWRGLLPIACLTCR